MKSKFDAVSSLAKFPLHNLLHCRTIAKVRLKWVKNRSLDHIIDLQTDIKAACLIKNAIIRSPTGYLTSKSLQDSHKLLGLTVPTMRFMRRYPTLFQEYPHPKYASLPCFKLTELGKMMHEQELGVYEQCQDDIVERLCRLLMMTRSQMVNTVFLFLLLVFMFGKGVFFHKSDWWMFSRMECVCCLQMPFFWDWCFLFTKMCFVVRT